METQQMSELINTFCRMMVRTGYQTDKFPGLKICLIQESDGWSLIASEVKPNDAKLSLDFPSMPDDPMDGVIKLSTYLYRRLSGYFRGVKANQSRDAEARRKSAKKAIATRWSK